jgi:hypothetical protein
VISDQAFQDQTAGTNPPLAAAGLEKPPALIISSTKVPLPALYSREREISIRPSFWAQRRDYEKPAAKFWLALCLLPNQAAI